MGGGGVGSAAMRLFARDDDDLGTKVSDVPPQACEWEGRARTTVRMKPHWGSFIKFVENCSQGHVHARQGFINPHDPLKFNVQSDIVFGKSVQISGAAQQDPKK